MADGPALALQAAVVARLKAVSAVSDLVGGRVHDEPPQGGPLPFLRLGAMEVTPLRTDCHDHWTVRFGIEAHSRPPAGRVEATRIIEAAVAALNGQEAAITVAGFRMPWLWVVTQSADRAGDGRSYAAVAVFEAHLEPV